MQELCPDIPICCEMQLGDRWYKDMDQQATSGQIAPISRRPLNNSCDSQNNSRHDKQMVDHLTISSIAH
jgi:hypothetical protein